MRGATFLVLAALLATAAMADDFECAFCGLAVNAVEGYLNEGLPESEIEALVNSTICAHLGSEFSHLCDDVDAMLPTVISKLENHESANAICQDLKACALPSPSYPSLSPVTHTTINLDLAPAMRWAALWRQPFCRDNIQGIISFWQQLAPGVLKIAEDLGNYFLDHFPAEYKYEIEGGANAIGVSPGFIALANLGYTLSDVCTSIVAQTKDGTILHARNLDFGIGMGFSDRLRNMTVQVAFQSQGETMYEMATYCGFVGGLTIMSPGKFAATINTRFQTETPMAAIIEELKEAIKHAQLNSFFFRDVAATATSFDDAVQMLEDTPIIAPVYFTVSGVKPGQGVVITRNQTGSAIPPRYIGQKEMPSWDMPAFAVLETNYDWDKPAPWFDDRRHYAIQQLAALGQADVSLPRLLSDVLSFKPVLNQMTTYSILASAHNGSLTTYSRYCDDPCPE